MMSSAIAPWCSSADLNAATSVGSAGLRPEFMPGTESAPLARGQAQCVLSVMRAARPDPGRPEHEEDVMTWSFTPGRGAQLRWRPGSPQAAAAKTVSTNSRNVIACTLVQYRQMLPMMNSSA